MAALHPLRQVTGRAVARLTSGRRMLPSFLVVGTKRGGSTSLYEYVARHPGVAPCAAKKGTHYFDVNFDKGWSWFRSWFPLESDGRITGEASPYYMYHPHAAARIAAALPDVKLVAALRNPVDRAYSHYSYNVRRGFETLSLTEALDREEERLGADWARMLAEPGYESPAVRHHAYLARGRYAEQLERLYATVDPERVLLLQSEALFADTDAELARVWRFLGLPPHRLGSVERFKAGSYEPIAFEARDRLQSYFADPNHALYALPGVEFRWPSAAPTGDRRAPTG